MAAGSPSKASSVLDVLADVSPSAQARSSALTVPLDWFRWLPAMGVRLFPVSSTSRAENLAFEQEIPTVAVDRRSGERLAAIDRIRPGEKRSLRVGWLFVAGRRPLGGGRMQRVLHPLISVPVRIVLPPLLGDALVSAAGDVVVSELVADLDRRHELEATYELGGGALNGMTSAEIDPALLARLGKLHRFASAAAVAAGFDTAAVVPVTGGPEQLFRGNALAVVAGVAVYTATDVGGLSAAASLRSWAERPLPATAFHALYLDTDVEADEDASGPTSEAPGQVVAPFALTPDQRRAVTLSRVSTVSVVSGAAGTGKSHTVSAIACDAVGRGETVLLAAKSEAAVDALLLLLRQARGLDPVVFGSSERRDELARRLASGQLRAVGRPELADAERARDQAVAARDDLAAAIVERLAAESHLERDDVSEQEARRIAPGIFDPACVLSEAGRLLDVASTSGGWWARRRARKARMAYGMLAGAGGERTLAELRAATGMALQVRAAGDLVAAGGLDLAAEWARLEHLESEVHRLVGKWLTHTSRSPARLNRATLPAVAVLGTALRSGRAARRAQLSRLDDRLTRALPLWVGTLGDIEDLLPQTPALFDLVILDEASAIDQPLAVPALLRARRAVVVGDPHQLRHVSFLADDQVIRAAEDHGLDGDPLLVARLDVRRNSMFDVAVATAPSTVLTEHFRSAPHLVDFVARRLYGGQLQVATRTPRTEARDCIEVVRMSGRRDEGGIVRGEVEEVLKRLRTMGRQGARSVGIISPFRAQATALEEAILEALTIDEIEALDLRVGTVHAFQGNERDVVMVSLGIGDDDGPGTWRFVQDPHLFAVLATRARQRLVLLLSAEPPSRGLVADYLAQADEPPGRPHSGGVPAPWPAWITGGLTATGVPAVGLYPTGRHTVEVCAGDERRFLGLECSVHPAGPAAHVDRHLALRRAGWELVDAYPSRWSERRGELLVDLVSRLKPDRGAGPEVS